jgi:two-component system chemotaxis sensor kinase CheA
MDDLLWEFLTETNESLDTVDAELVRFEQEPNNAKILDNIFRLVHTIKGTCGFIGLPRLQRLAHAAETLMGKFRDGMSVTGEAVTLVLSTIDRTKDLLKELEKNQREPEGNDDDLIAALERMAQQVSAGGKPAPARFFPAKCRSTNWSACFARPPVPGQPRRRSLRTTGTRSATRARIAARAKPPASRSVSTSTRSNI